ncbi:MAG: 23S rRNA (adenine(2503)-C(2))-methyltransferase RlmN [Syntrophales bacterium]|nr:23S rRNA (adenine(2503)-C(2))-methyltransferase RlmN [Syntrophales bacterium]
MSGKPHLKDMTLEEMEAYFAEMGKERYRARQVMKWLYQRGAQSFDVMTDLSKEFRDKLKEMVEIRDPEIVKTSTSIDGTKKVLFQLEDGHKVESVLIPGKNHWTACLSTQVGCAMGCLFCFTGTIGLKRNLRASEIVGQLIRLRFETPEGASVKNVVLMGMGEPLANYENTLKAIKNFTSDYGMGFSTRKITVSTCGIAPKIVQLGHDIRVNLAVSLNAPDNERRSTLMPINRLYPIEALLQACRDYPMPGRRMLTFEYVLLGDFNDTIQDAKKLARLLRGIRCKVNLIAFNEFPGSRFKSPSPEAIRNFQQVLLDAGYTTIVRTSRGKDICAACGQLSGQ